MSQTPFRVVIAEDEALIRLDLKEMLEEDGYVIAGEAADGEAAVKLTESLRPDLVIMDVKMPVLDGVSAAERITAQHLAPVVILTAFSQSDLVKRARDAGAMAYLVKPFTKADLIPAIEIAVSRFQEISVLEAEVGTLRERLEVRKLLDRAKGILQAERGITEAEAFRWIQKTSMDRRMTMRAVAEEVLAGQHPGRPQAGRDPSRRSSAGWPATGTGVERSAGDCGPAGPLSPGKRAGPGAQPPGCKARRPPACAATRPEAVGGGEPEEPLVPCQPSPGRHVLYSASPGSAHHGSDALARRAKTLRFPGRYGGYVP